MKDHKEILLSFGENLRKLRTAKGLSQEELAFQADFDRTYISLLERGKRNLSLVNICRLADTLQVDVNELLKNIY
jgi:transcriptional regulator with XRE-family HTH domain